MDRVKGRLPIEEKLTAKEIADLRMKCAEVVFSSGSSNDRAGFDKRVNELYNLVVDRNPETKPDTSD